MTKEELAAKLNGREYTQEMTKEEEAEANRNGLVVIFGASDDLIEFRGAIHDEEGAYDGTTVLIDPFGLLPGIVERDDELEDLFRRRKTAQAIEAVRAHDGVTSWAYKTDIPHALFDIMEDGEVYCRGIVIDMPRRHIIDRKFEFLAKNPCKGTYYDETNAIVFLAKDKAFLFGALPAYREKCIELGSNPEHIESIDLLIGRVADFQSYHESKVPDTETECEIRRCVKGELG